MEAPVHVGPRRARVVVFDAAEELDFVGPWEVLGVASNLFPGSYAAELVSLGPPSISAHYGLTLSGLRSLYESGPPRLVIVPGGVGRRVAMKDPRLLDYLREVHRSGGVVASVCTGAFVLAEAGLLTGRRATTHASALDELRGYANVTVVEDRVVDEGDIVTSGGISAGIDMALHLVERDLGVKAAEEVARTMEFRRAPRSGPRPMVAGDR